MNTGHRDQCSERNPERKAGRRDEFPRLRVHSRPRASVRSRSFCGNFTFRSNICGVRAPCSGRRGLLGRYFPAISTCRVVNEIARGSGGSHKGDCSGGGSRT